MHLDKAGQLDTWLAVMESRTEGKDSIVDGAPTAGQGRVWRPSQRSGVEDNKFLKYSILCYFSYRSSFSPAVQASSPIKPGTSPGYDLKIETSRKENSKYTTNTSNCRTI